jgi:hypothetical protein
VLGANIKVSKTFYPNDTISVQAAKTEAGSFSSVFGLKSANIAASAKALVGSPTGVRYVAPMVVYCDHDLIKKCNQSGNMPKFGVQTTLPFSKEGAPGAFGMLNLSKDGGTPGSSEEADWILHGYDALLDVNKDYNSDPGAKFSSNQVQDALNARMTSGIPLLFPVFQRLDGTGQNAQYYIIGWIGFHLDSYVVNGNDATLTGYFTEYIASGVLSSNGSGPPNYGVKSIQLIE